MLRSSQEDSRLYLTADLRAVDGQAPQKFQKPKGRLFSTEMKRFPPVEDVVATLDRIASRAFVA